MILRMTISQPYYSVRQQWEREGVSGHSPIAPAVNSMNECNFESLFCAHDSRPHHARAVHFVGSVRRLSHALAPGPSLAAYRFSCLGDAYGTPSFAVSSDCAREICVEAKAGVQPYQGGFLLHYLNKPVYPDIS